MLASCNQQQQEEAPNAILPSLGEPVPIQEICNLMILMTSTVKRSLMPGHCIQSQPLMLSVLLWRIILTFWRIFSILWMIWNILPKRMSKKCSEKELYRLHIAEEDQKWTLRTRLMKLLSRVRWHLQAGKIEIQAIIKDSIAQSLSPNLLLGRDFQARMWIEAVSRDQDLACRRWWVRQLVFLAESNHMLMICYQVIGSSKMQSIITLQTIFQKDPYSKCPVPMKRIKSSIMS